MNSGLTKIIGNAHYKTDLLPQKLAMVSILLFGLYFHSVIANHDPLSAGYEMFINFTGETSILPVDNVLLLHLTDIYATFLLFLERRRGDRSGSISAIMGTSVSITAYFTQEATFLHLGLGIGIIEAYFFHGKQ